MIRLLTFTSLYPNRFNPRHGIFVEQRLRRLVDTGLVSSRVVVPVRWPSLFLDVSIPPYQDQRFGLEVSYPRFVPSPIVGGLINPILMALAAWPTVARMARDDTGFDVLDAQYFFPDGVAGAILGRWLGKPVTITARGTDLNHFSKHAVSRAWIKWAAARARHLITVSEALKTVLVSNGIADGHISVLRNGVDMQAFRPTDRDHAKEALKVAGHALLSVGNLVPEKGHNLVIKALARMENTELIIVGSGPEEGALRGLARELNLETRVRWVGNLPQSDLITYYNASDATVLASSREGMPNVLLESLACGTPVIAANVGGVPEVIASPVAGVCLNRRTPAGIVDAWQNILVMRRPPSDVRNFAARFGWEEPISRQIEVLRRVAASETSNSSIH